MLQPGELNREAFFEMADDPARYLAERDQCAERRSLVGGDAGARLRHVDDPATDIEAVGQDQAGDRVARDQTSVAAVFGQIKDVAVGEPGQLRGEFVALARRRRYRHRKAALKDARDMAFEAAQMIDIGDDPFAGRAGLTRGASRSG